MCQPLKGQNTHGRAHFPSVQIIEQIIVSRYHNYMFSHLFYYIIIFYDIAGYHFQWHLIVFVGLGPLVYLIKKTIFIQFFFIYICVCVWGFILGATRTLLQLIVHFNNYFFHFNHQTFFLNWILQVLFVVFHELSVSFFSYY